MGDGPFEAAAAAVTPPDANALDAHDGETGAAVPLDATVPNVSVRDAGALHNPLAVAASLQLLLDSGCGAQDDRLWPYIVRLAELTGLRRGPTSGGTAAETSWGACSPPTEADRVRLLRAGVTAMRKAARGTAVDAELADLLHMGGSESRYNNHATGTDTLWMPGWALEACWRWAATPADNQSGRAVAWPDLCDLYRLLAEREARIAQRACERMTVLRDLSADTPADIGDGIVVEHRTPSGARPRARTGRKCTAASGAGESAASASAALPGEPHRPLQGLPRRARTDQRRAPEPQPRSAQVVPRPGARGGATCPPRRAGAHPRPARQRRRGVHAVVEYGEELAHHGGAAADRPLPDADRHQSASAEGRGEPERGCRGAGP
eukprot:ctg_101.g42